MQINKLKFLTTILFYFVCALCMETWGMEDKPQEQHSNIQKSETSCSHWGLSHWVSGIKEYTVDRCLFGGKSFNEIDPDRSHIIRREMSDGRYEISNTTDCYCVECCIVTSCCESCPTPNGIMLGTLCCPIATMMHLLCLPCASVFCTPDPHIVDIQDYQKAQEQRNKVRADEEERQKKQKTDEQERQKKQKQDMDEYYKAQKELKKKIKNMTAEERKAYDDEQAEKKRQSDARTFLYQPSQTSQIDRQNQICAQRFAATGSYY